MAKLTEDALKKNIRNQIYDNLYFLYGEEKMLVGLYQNKLKEKLIGKEPSDFNYHVFEEGSQINEIAQVIDIVPFAERCNYVLINDLNIEKLSEEDMKVFCSLLENIPETTVLVISMITFVPTGKKAARWNKLIKVTEKYGTAVNLERRSPQMLKKQLISWAEKGGCTLLPANAEKIIAYSGQDLQTLQNELIKLCAFCEDGEITATAIEKLVAKNLEARIFDLADAVIKCDADRAFKTLDILMYQKEEPVTVLAVLSSTYIDIYRVKIAAQSGESNAQIVNDFDYKRKEFRLKKAQGYSHNLSDESLLDCIALLADTNAVMNSSAVNKQLLLEQLLGNLMLTSKRR